MIRVPIDVLLPVMLAAYAVGGATGALILFGLGRPRRSECYSPRTIRASRRSRIVAR